jgi:hypothetical protein
MLSNLSNWFIAKFPYFANTTERRGDKGWKEAQRQGEERVTLGLSLNDLSPKSLSTTKIDGFVSFNPPTNVLFGRFFF